MKWTKLTIENFMSIEKAEVDLSDRGLILIEGINETNDAFQSNGSGKSSVLDSIVYALYDTTSKGVKADDVVNRVVGKNTVVTLEGIKDEDTYRIERYRKHSKNKNKVKLFINGNDVTEKSTADTNKAIERIVGIDYNTFINSIMFSQGSGAGRFASATDREKKEILENLVNLEVYAKAQEVAKERVKNKENDIDLTKREIEKVEIYLYNVDNLEQQDQERYEQTKTMIETEKSRLEELQKKKEDFVSTNLDTIKKLRESIIPQLKQKQEEHYPAGIDQGIVTEVRGMEGRLAEGKRDLSYLHKEKEKLVHNYRKIQEDTHCPVCGNELDTQHRQKEMESIKNSLRELLSEVNQKTQEVEKLQALYEQKLEEYKSQESAVQESNHLYNEITKKLTSVEEKIRKYDHTVSLMDSDINNTQGTIEKLLSVPQPSPRTEEREKYKEQINSLKTRLLELENDKKKLEDVVKVFSNSGIKSHVLDLVTPFLNKQANKYLSLLTGSDVEIVFSTQSETKKKELRDKFDVKVLNNSGGGTYSANSEGEKKRIDLAISLAIQDLVMSKSELKTNFIVYDEVFDALDSVGSENVVTLLRERLDMVESIFVITHSEHLRSLFEQVMTVKKDKHGLSKIIEGGAKT